LSLKTLLKSSAVAVFCASATLTTIATLPAAAHHGVNGQFDLSQTLEVTGVVTRVRFVNPHSYVYFDVTNDAGEVENWRCELRSGSLLKRKGWKTDMFAKGTELTIFGSPAREEATTCYTETITFSDGNKLFRYGAVDDDGTLVNTESAIAAAANLQEEPAMSAPDLSGDWGEPIADGPPRPYAGSGGPYVPAPIVATEAEKWNATPNPRFECKATNIILDYRFDQMANRFEQTETEVKISYGFMDVQRTIHIGGDFSDMGEASLAGYSVGNWNGKKLEVTTKNFAPGFLAVAGGRTVNTLPHSDQMEITEVFYIDDAGELVREYTINDPVYLAEAYSHFDKAVRADGEYQPFGCDDLTEEAEFADKN
jgi:hypothetical protein